MSKQYTYDADIVSDLHKDAYGFRPSYDFWRWWDSANDEERQWKWDQLLKDLEYAVQEEKERQVRAVRDFERLVADLMSLGAGTRETALEWIMQSEEGVYEGDWEHLAFRHGLPFTYFNKKKEAA